MIPTIQLNIPQFSPDDSRHTNASILVRKKDTNSLSTYLTHEDDTLEAVFREKFEEFKGYNGIVLRTTVRPYTWEHTEVCSVFDDGRRQSEDPRLWIYKEKNYVSMTHDGSIVFAEYDIENKKLLDLNMVLFGRNGGEGLEKNWGFFEDKTTERLCILYCPSPLVIVEIENGNLIKHQVNQWTNIEFRGGSPPILHQHENVYYTFLHKLCEYKIWCVSFYKNDEGEWKVKGYTEEALDRNDKNTHPIHFVSGAVYDTMKDRWILSGGFGDISVAFWTILHSDLLKKMKSY